jgi:hypothetical protein
MTPTSPRPNDKRASGNPARQAEINLTVKQQRELKKQEKLVEYQKMIAKRRRSRLAWWIGGSTAAIVVIGAIVASIVFAPAPPAAYTPGSDGAEIEGVETFQNTAIHVEGAVDYPQSPPTGGDHNAIWLNCGIYTEPQPNENAVHSLEHGAVWITYDAESVTDDELATLKEALPSSYVILSPYEGLDAPIVLSNWNNQLKVESADDPRIAEFLV